ncbi:MAG: hypothetical protein AAGA28_19530 [Pseudomonadota bacterium]
MQRHWLRRAACLALTIAGVCAMAVQAGEPAQQTDAARTVPLGPDPVLGGGAFNRGGGITVAGELRRTVDGRMAVCAVWARSARLDIFGRTRARDALAPASIFVDGTQVRRDLRVFPQVAPTDRYAGAQARCVGTGQAWRVGATLRFHVPYQVLENEGGGRGSYRLTISPARVPNPALGAGSLLPERWTQFPQGGPTVSDED